MSDLGVKRRGCNSALTKPKLCVSTQARNARKRPRKVNVYNVWPSSFNPCTHTTPTPWRGLIVTHHIYPYLQEVKQFDYLGLRLDPMVNMKAAVSSIQKKSNKAHSLLLAVFYSLRYDKHHSNPTICSSPVEVLDLWKSCVIPHFLLYLRYISDETQLKTI